MAGKLDTNLTTGQKISNKLEVANLISDEMLSYPILAKLPLDPWHIVDTIFLNKDIESIPNFILNKLKEIFHLENSPQKK